MRPSTRKHLLWKEGASRPDRYAARSSERLEELRRKRHRKLRKLKRQAKKKGRTLDEHLAIREGERRDKALRQAIGERIRYTPSPFLCASSGISYVCEIVDAFKEKEEQIIWLRQDGKYRKRLRRRTYQAIRLKVLGYASLPHDPPASWVGKPPYPVGHEVVVPARTLDPWHLSQPLEPRTLGECAFQRIDHAEQCLRRSQVLLAATSGKEPTRTSVAEADHWARKLDDWKAWLETLPEEQR